MPIKVNIQSPLPAKYIWRLLLLIWTVVVVIYPWKTQTKDWGNGYQEYQMGQSLAFADVWLTNETLAPAVLKDYLALHRDWPVFNYRYSYHGSFNLFGRDQKDITFRSYLAHDQLKSARLLFEPGDVDTNRSLPIIPSDFLGSNLNIYFRDTFQEIITIRPGITPAHIKLLLDYGFKLNQLDSTYNTPLNLTLISNLNSPLTEDPSIEFLLKNGADPNLYATHNPHTYPPLFYTRFDSDDPHIDILLQYGANPYLKVRDESFIEMLRRRGMDTIADDIEARYPAHQYNNPE